MNLMAIINNQLSNPSCYWHEGQLTTNCQNYAEVTISNEVIARTKYKIRSTSMRMLPRSLRAPSHPTSCCGGWTGSLAGNACHRPQKCWYHLVMALEDRGAVKISRKSSMPMWGKPLFPSVCVPEETHTNHMNAHTGGRPRKYMSYIRVSCSCANVLPCCRESCWLLSFQSFPKMLVMGHQQWLNMLNGESVLLRDYIMISTDVCSHN